MTEQQSGERVTVEPPKNEAIVFDLVWMQRLGGGTEVLKRRIPAAEALIELQRADRENYGVGSVCFLRPADDVLAAVANELVNARDQHDPLNSAHEAYAVILEELDEFKAEVWKSSRKRDRAAMRAELIQIAAMAIRTIEDLSL